MIESHDNSIEKISKHVYDVGIEWTFTKEGLSENGPGLKPYQFNSY